MKLNKKEREAAEFLKQFADGLLEGNPVHYEKPVIEQLRRMGIDLQFVSHKQVKTLRKGKEDPYPWVITNAPWYIRGAVSKTYLPFQIRELKLDVEKEKIAHQKALDKGLISESDYQKEISACSK